MSSEVRGEIAAVLTTEKDANVFVARHHAGPEAYVTIVPRGMFTWAVYVDRGEDPDA